MADLDKIFVRARMNEKYESKSLQELWDCGEGGQAFEWFLERLNNSEELNLTEDTLHDMVQLLEKLGIRVYKLP